MKKEDLFDILGDIDSQYIKEAHTKDERKGIHMWVKCGAVAACLAFLFVGVPLITQLFPATEDNIPEIDAEPLPNNSKVEDLQQSVDEATTPPEKADTLVVNEVENIMSADMDVQITSLDKLPHDVWVSVQEEFEENVGISYEEFTNKIPNTFECNHFYTLSTPGYKDADLEEGYRLHDYVFEYCTENGGEVTIAICSFEEPLRDCFIVCDNPVPSEMNGVEVLIYRYQEHFMVQFSHGKINYDIGTNNITLSELEDLLLSITDKTEKNLIHSSSTEILGTVTEDVPADSNGEYSEAVNINDITKDTTAFFGGSYLDENGNFVVVLTEDTPANRTAICRELGRNERNTTFVKGTYTLAYLTELQEKISNAMVNKEIPFVITSSVRETTNNIVISVTTNDEAELEKVYALDTIGGAIKVELGASVITEELVLLKP